MQAEYQPAHNPEFQKALYNHLHFTYNSDAFKQRFALKTLSVVFVQLIATVLINIFLFHLTSYVSQRFISMLSLISSFGAIICILTTCFR